MSTASSFLSCRSVVRTFSDSILTSICNLDSIQSFLTRLYRKGPLLLLILSSSPTMGLPAPCVFFLPQCVYSLDLCILPFLKLCTQRVSYGDCKYHFIVTINCFKLTELRLMGIFFLLVDVFPPCGFNVKMFTLRRLEKKFWIHGR